MPAPCPRHAHHARATPTMPAPCPRDARATVLCPRANACDGGVLLRGLVLDGVHVDALLGSARGVLVRPPRPCAQGGGRLTQTLPLGQ
eukprot:gene14095-biopygen17079